jgi:glycosyltransferase involved in cell wall biosynthesis
VTVTNPLNNLPHSDQAPEVERATLTSDEADGTFVIIAAYNEARVIREVVERVLSLGVHVVVVDDASTDGTADTLTGLPISVLSHSVNLGQGAALRTGAEFALAQGARYMVTFDADGQHDEADIPRLIHMLTVNGRQVALSSRFLGKEATGMGPSRKLLLKAAVAYTRLTTGLRLTDAHNGLRACCAEVAPMLHLRQNRMAHASEILQLIKDGGLSYAEVPTVVHYTAYSKAKGQTGIGLVDILFDQLMGRFFR